MSRRAQTPTLDPEHTAKPDRADESRGATTDSDDDRIVFSSWDAPLVPSSRPK